MVWKEYSPENIEGWWEDGSIQNALFSVDVWIVLPCSAQEEACA